MKFKEGDIVITSYNTGPYVIDSIERGCECPSYLDEINLDDPPKSKKHIHIVCHHLDEKKRKGRECYLSGYDDQSGVSVWGDDYLIYRGNVDVQLSLL